MCAIESDWVSDAHGGETLAFAEFFDTMFELTDTWCDGISVAGYVGLLARLYDAAERDSARAAAAAPPARAAGGSKPRSATRKQVAVGAGEGAAAIGGKGVRVGAPDAVFDAAAAMGAAEGAPTATPWVGGASTDAHERRSPDASGPGLASSSANWTGQGPQSRLHGDRSAQRRLYAGERTPPLSGWDS